MDWSGFQNWLSTANLLVVCGALLAGMSLAALAGAALRRARDKGRSEDDSGQEGYIVSAVLGLLALLLGFTFSMAVDRFEARRGFVLEEANAIGTAYLRTQALPEPHRGRLSELIGAYVENRVELGHARPGRQKALLETNDRLLGEIWAGSLAAFDSVKSLDFSSTYMESVNALIDMDESRKAARAARVPPQVFAVLFLYLFTAAGVLGYVLRGSHGRTASLFLMVLLTLTLALIVDIDRPVMGSVIEGQGPMLDLQRSIAAQSRSDFDRWRVAPEER